MIFKLPADSVIVRSKDSSHKGNTVAAIPGAFAEVKFDAHDSTFMMFYSACENPGCSCTDVVFTFSGKCSQSNAEHPRMEFGVEFNVDTWKVGRIYGESSFARSLIDEFVSGLNADHKNDILAKYRSFRLAVENAARFSLPAGKVRKGHMVAADEVFGSGAKYTRLLSTIRRSVDSRR